MAENDVVTRSVAEGREEYWEHWYARRSSAGQARPVPSQFAAFVVGELDGPHDIVELGCGGGRDSLFFASYGHRVVGVDASAAAVSSCEQLADGFGVDARFVHAAVDDPGLPDRVGAPQHPRAVYARFFVHAITDEEEERFLDLAARLTTSGDLLAVEYRTIRDRSGEKETGAHYRRFVLPARFQSRALERGFDVEYDVEGFGFAKYRHDDAYVARTIFRRR
ncbi:Methyltransferase type 12 [Nostocoides japonicum T1-X7]|uniref:Methyltransferase type 12 n=1 Tax=Nostocoides japonicum T1-X7 TaxID=1194083 RepID=A0A077M2L2_9MICO|nr:class I SAM-dependent methyltransferase [Tetrasphaera japonica]CCH79247.1 Methyltransferase type 12 [Tetrasphaera japonica T1-X7]